MRAACFIPIKSNSERVKGKKVFNATSGVHLEVFDRINFDDLIKGE